jgi:hypothetical protein
MVIPALNRTRGPLPSQGSALGSAELRDNEIGGGGGNRTHSLNLARIGRPYDCHPQMLPAGVAPASSALEASRSFSVELRQRKMEPRPGIAPGKCRFADDRVSLARSRGNGAAPW